MLLFVRLLAIKHRTTLIEHAITFMDDLRISSICTIGLQSTFPAVNLAGGKICHWRAQLARLPVWFLYDRHFRRQHKVNSNIAANIWRTLQTLDCDDDDANYFFYPLSKFYYPLDKLIRRRRKQITYKLGDS